MKGGKGGEGRKRPPAKPVGKEKTYEGPKRGEAKRDWGAVDREDPLPPVPDKPKRRPTSS